MNYSTKELSAKFHPADICRMKSWIVGTRLAGDEGYGLTVIEITAIGEQHILAKAVSHKGHANNRVYEATWALGSRDWNVIE